MGTVDSFDTAGIDVLGRNLQTAFRAGWQITSPSVLNLFSSAFKHEGVDRDTIIRWIAEDTGDMLGAQFLPAKVLNCSNVNSTPVCNVLFTVKYTDGAFEPFIFPVIREGSSWKIYGDQAPVSTEYGAVVYRVVAGNAAAVTRSGFNIQVDDDAAIGDDDVGFIKAWFGADTSGDPDFVYVNPAKVAGSCNNSSLGGFF